MERVLAEAGEAKTIFLSAKASATATSSPQAYEARQHFSKGAFPELRTACVRYGGRLTRELLELERDIDDFRSRTQGGAPSAYGAIPQLGLHAGFDDQLGGCKPHPATAPAGSNRSSHGGNKMAEAFGVAGHV